MDFIEGKCPACKGILQMPSDRDTIICMYCGQELSVKEAMEEKEKVQAPKNQEAFKESRAVLDQQLTRLLSDVSEPLKKFNRTEYEDAFYEYVKEHEQILCALQTALEEAEEETLFAEEMSRKLVKYVQEELAKLKNKRKKEEQLLEYNMTLVAYVFTSVLHSCGRVGERFTRSLEKNWKEAFPTTNIKGATFQEINGGFRKRFCYISTAVCKSIGKPDDCYELNLLRQYRDTYLSSTKEGEEMVKEYYNIAPTILKRIRKEGDPDRVYKEIWEQYLQPCIALIEGEEFEECQGIYEAMVHALHSRYFEKGQ